MNYKALMWGCIALTVACWGLATGLAIEKVLADGVTSYTLLFAMPVLTLAIGWLIHQGVSDLREFAIFRGAAAVALAVLALGVTLPNSIGSAGGAKDTAVAEAEAANRGISFASGELAKAQKDLEDAKGGVLRECEGAPAVIPDKTWPKCQWWRRQVEAHTLAVSKYGSAVVAAPVVKQALSGETRIAWALQKVGVAVTEKDVQMAQPMALPIAAELLCAFFMFMAFEFHRLSTSAKSLKCKTVTDGSDLSLVGSDETQAGSDRQSFATRGRDLSVVAGDPELAQVSDTELQRLRRYFQEKAEGATGPEPSPTKPRKSKRQKRREKVQNWVREYTLQNGHPPAFRVVKGRFHLPAATASRWRHAALN
jgi:hypothetical protein